MASTILWRRLDVPGHDICRLEGSSAGWTLDGVAVSSENGEPARLAYQVACDPVWRTREGRVHGWIGDRPIEFVVRRIPAGGWILNDAAVPDLDRYLDLDLGFTPATNLFQIRRVALAIGAAAEVPVAWLDLERSTLVSMSQRYERRSELAYWYESPQYDYAALLEVDPVGFVRRYPGLWEAEL